MYTRSSAFAQQYVAILSPPPAQKRTGQTLYE